MRKLELLMAEALAGGCDCVVTVGGLQSNHCRATAAAARLVGLEAHLVLLVADHAAGDDPGLQGNLLLDRLLGANLHMCAASDYYKYGGDLAAMDKLNQLVASRLRAQGRKPYVVPVGGTTPMSAWAYISATDELITQCREGRLPTQEGGVPSEQGSVPPPPPKRLDEGVRRRRPRRSLSTTLCSRRVPVARPPASRSAAISLRSTRSCTLSTCSTRPRRTTRRSMLRLAHSGSIRQRRVSGSPSMMDRPSGMDTRPLNSSSRFEIRAPRQVCFALAHFLSLTFSHSISLTHFISPTLSYPLYLTHFISPTFSHTPMFSPYMSHPMFRICHRDLFVFGGVLLDHVYTGKALHFFCKAVRADPEAFRGSRILFWHTGGLFGLYSKSTPLKALLPQEAVQRLEVPDLPA